MREQKSDTLVRRQSDVFQKTKVAGLAQLVEQLICNLRRPRTIPHIRLTVAEPFMHGFLRLTTLSQTLPAPRCLASREVGL